MAHTHPEIQSWPSAGPQLGSTSGKSAFSPSSSPTLDLLALALTHFIDVERRCREEFTGQAEKKAIKSFPRRCYCLPGALAFHQGLCQLSTEAQMAGFQAP